MFWSHGVGQYFIHYITAYRTVWLCTLGGINFVDAVVAGVTKHLDNTIFVLQKITYVAIMSCVIRRKKHKWTIASDTWCTYETKHENKQGSDISRSAIVCIYSLKYNNILVSSKYNKVISVSGREEEMLWWNHFSWIVWCNNYHEHGTITI